MTTFEFLVTIFGIVVALNISRLLSGTSILIANWKTSDLYIFYVVWILLLLSIQIGWWFSIWRFSDTTEVTIGQFLWRFHVPALAYIACHLTVPSEKPDFESLYENRRPAFFCAGLPLLLGPTLAVVFVQAYQFLALNAVGLLLFSGIIIKNIRYHNFMLLTSLIIYVSFIVIYRGSVGT